MFMMMKSMCLIIPMLMSVALLTLIESKMLGYTQMSKGPNIMGMYGLLQPLSDGIKLFTKETLIPNHVNMFMFTLSPIISFIMSMFVWNFLYFNSQEYFNENNLSLLIMIGVNSLGVYTIMMAGWSSNSKYGFLGAMSATSQMMSYEMSMGFLLGNMMMLSESFNLSKMYFQQMIYNSFMFSLLPVSLLFFMSLLVEINSAPFDLTEGESELVSGYNMEYSSFMFALFFLAEYSHIMFSSMFFSMLFFSNYYTNNLMMSMLLMMIMLMISSSFPSFSYDKLMYLLWKTYLPVSIIFIMLNIMLMMMC